MHNMVLGPPQRTRANKNVTMSRCTRTPAARMMMTREQLEKAGFHVSDAEYARLIRFVELLLAENERTNLTAVRDAAQVWPLHICDSLTLLPLVERFKPRAVVDLGTGGGVPGLPLACVLPEVRFTLVDATRKKIEAVERIGRSLGLENCHYVWGRGEALAHEPPHRERYDVVIARAVASLENLARYASGLIRPNGQAWFMKSCQAAEAERRAAERATTRHQLIHAATETVRLPEPHGERAMLVYEKRGALPFGLPK